MPRCKFEDYTSKTLCVSLSRGSRRLKISIKNPVASLLATGFFHLSVYHLVEQGSTSTRTFVKCPLILYLQTSKMLQIYSGGPDASLKITPRKHFVFPRSRQSPLKNKHKKPGCKQACTGYIYAYFIIFSLFSRRLFDNCSNTTRTYCSTTFTDSKC